MKISNETKVGALTAIAITILVLGFNFLKGKSLFNKQRIVYAVYENTQSLPDAADVKYKGLKIGTTAKAMKIDKFASKVVVPIILSDHEILMPRNSIAIITSSGLVSAPFIDIKPGKDFSNFIKNGDTLLTNASSDMLSEVTKQLNPVLYEVENAVHSLDSVLKVIGNTFDPNTKSNFQSILANVNKTTANLIGTTAALQNLLNAQTGTIASSLKNLETFTENLNKNNTKINSTLSNIDKASSNFATLDVKAPIDNLTKTITQLQNVIGKFNNDKGTLGLLLKDPDLYNQMHSLTFSLNTLVDDLKVNPKRYISIFGRKDKKIPALTKPLSDTTKIP